MGAGVPHVFEAILPELAYCGAREFVVFRIRRVGIAPVDQVGDGDLVLLAKRRLQQLVVRVVVQVGRELFHQPDQCTAQVPELLYALRVEPCLARILDVLRALEHLIEVRQAARPSR